MRAETMFVNSFIRDAGSDVPMHIHSSDEAVFYGEGCRGTLLVGDAKFDIRENSVAVIGRGMLHGEHHTGRGRVVFFGFNCEKAPRIGIYGGRESLKPYFDEIFSEARDFDAFSTDKMTALATLVVIDLCRDGKSGREKVKSLDFCRRYIEANFTQAVSVRELADFMGYGYDYFRHIFKENYGISPVGLVTKLRTEYAEKLLVSTTLSCTKIAAVCGFYDSAQMSKALAKTRGMAPTEIRRKSGK